MRAAPIAALFLIAGPALAAACQLTFIILWTTILELGGEMPEDMRTALLILAGVFYVIGGPAFFLAGIGTAIASRTRSVSMLQVLVTTAIANAAASILWYGVGIAWFQSLYGTAEYDREPWRSLLIAVAVCALPAAAGCWAIGRRFRLL